MAEIANEQLEKPSFGGFTIDTPSNLGTNEVIDALFSETSTASPDDVKVIEEEKPVKSTPKKVEKKEEAPVKTLEDSLFTEEEEEAPKKQKSLKKEEQEEGDEEVEEGDGKAVSQIEALSKDLLKLGVFSQEEGEEVSVKTPEEFLERFNLEKKKGADEMIENFLGQFGDNYKEAFQAIYVNGVDPKEYFSSYNEIQNIAELDLSNESNQEKVVRQGLIESGLEPEDVKEEVEKIKNYGDLEEKSKKYHKILIKKETAKLQEKTQAAQQLQQQRVVQKQQYAKNVQSTLQDKLKAKDFDGIPLNPKLAQEVQDFLLTDKYTIQSTGEKITEFDRAILDLKRPENHAQKVKVALLLKVLEKDPTLTTIQRTGTSKKTDELFSEIAKQTSKTSKSSKPTSWWA